MSKEIFWRNATFIFFTSIPYPNTKKSGFHGNSVIANAANYYLRKHLQTARIDIFDTYSFSFLNSTNRVCGNHYLCRHGTKIFGDVGEAYCAMCYYDYVKGFID